ncbi:MAG: ABC transporter permease [Phycisphaeraceae bacterium]|nr:MAG: ABC transporter permease [Phycisphaeraceae bacterium]
MPRAEKTTRAVSQEAVSGVQLMSGAYQAPAKSFWVDVWGQVFRRPGAVMGIFWVAVVAFFAIFAPVLASGHPLILWELDEAGNAVSWSSPLFQSLTAVDLLILAAGVFGPLWLLLPLKSKRSDRMMRLVMGAGQAGVILLIAGQIDSYASGRDVADWVRSMERSPMFVPLAAAVSAVVGSIPFFFIPMAPTLRTRIVFVCFVGVLVALCAGTRWSAPLSTFDYERREMAGEIRAVYTVIPYSPNQRRLDLDLLPPGAVAADSTKFIGDPEEGAGAPYRMGTDSQGQDVLSQMLHACRLSISIGLVSTGIAVFIGVTIGALMGYFGGWVDMVLYRVVEVFMAIPVLFLLIVAAAVLPRNVFVMMAIIGCVTWTGAARFTRAEFYRLRNQDFVQAARAVGLPLRSILFRHMLPNGVTPVLVDASFAIAAAILAEAILSFLGLGPIDQASWGRLLADATNEVGAFIWWLAIFPGFAIFLTVLSYNMIGEALRDAIDPKLKKARV